MTTSKRKRGDVVRFKEPLVYKGKTAVVIKISSKTGDYTVELLEDVSEVITKGRRFSVHPHQVEDAKSRDVLPAADAE